ncbi:dihydroxyacetone phosphate acyltransferase isoform X2 [Aethina tumida]|nr:dihydroxyacetone phosphate acyltransferase isoform X2 [Aethina tumida]
MGNCPVIFVPSHRSYADFIQLSYVCFTFDIAIPAIAAGMDFHSMWGMGKILRDTGAFYMRRSYNDDSLYWTTFKQYVYQLVSKGDLPIEFFIEGTRSRSGKSLTPKYGLISMILKAFFLAQVPDILFVPISICYDRLLEENLFAFEHLGIPKPKETTKGFFKSLKIMKEKYGDTYIHFGTPISAKETFGDKLDRSVHNLAPIHEQEITEKEKSLIPSLGHQIVRCQQKDSIINVFNLIALDLNNNLTNSKKCSTLDEMQKQISILKNALETLGAYVAYRDNNDFENALAVHENLVRVDKDGLVNLVFNDIVLDVALKPEKMKGFLLSGKTMTRAIPFIMLQTYVNPTLHFFSDVALLIIILKNNSMSKDVLFEKFVFLKKLFAFEFVVFDPWIEQDFDRAITLALKLHCIKDNSGLWMLDNNEYLQSVFCSSIEPFFLSYYTVLLVLERIPGSCQEKTIFVRTQQILENALNEPNHFIHPYSMSLETHANCLNSLSSQKALIKSRRSGKIVYEVNGSHICAIKDKLGMYLPLPRLTVSITIHERIMNKL